MREGPWLSRPQRDLGLPAPVLSSAWRVPRGFLRIVIAAWHCRTGSVARRRYHRGDPEQWKHLVATHRYGVPALHTAYCGAQSAAALTPAASLPAQPGRWTHGPGAHHPGPRQPRCILLYPFVPQRIGLGSRPTRISLLCCCVGKLLALTSRPAFLRRAFLRVGLAVSCSILSFPKG